MKGVLTFLGVCLGVIAVLHQSVHAVDLGYINVKTYNAVGDGTTDDLSEINSAIAACVTLKNAGEKPVLYFPPGISYAVNGQVSVPDNIHVRMDAPIKYTGTSNIAALVVGDSDVSFFMDHKLSAIRTNLSSFSSEDNIAILVKNQNTSKIEIVQATRSTIGVQMIGDAAGFAYNTVHLGYLVDNKIAIDLTNSNNGWINENFFLKGRLSLTGGLASTPNIYGIRVNSKDGLQQANNNNLFIHPCFELNPTAIPVLMRYGEKNEIIGARNEGNSSTFARVENNSAYNDFNIGAGYSVSASTIQYAGNVAGGEATVRGTPFTNAASVIFDSGHLAKKACYYDGQTQVNVAGVHLANPSDANVYKSRQYINLNSNYLEWTYGGVGIFVDTSANKEFSIQKVVQPGRGGGVAIRCYNAAGQVLTNAGSNHPYVKSFDPGYSLTYFSDYGGTYMTGTDYDGPLTFSVHNDVKYIAIILVNGTQSLQLQSFKVIGRRTATAWPGYDQIIPGVNLATQAPTGGTWPKGLVILNDAKSVLGSSGSQYIIEGWECIQSGTPGTWVQKRSLTGT